MSVGLYFSSRVWKEEGDSALFFMSGSCWKDQNSLVGFGREMMLVVRGRNQPGRKRLLKVFVKDGRTRVVSPLSRFQVQWQAWKSPKDHSGKFRRKVSFARHGSPFCWHCKKDLSWWNSSLCIPYSLEEKKPKQKTISRGWRRESVSDQGLQNAAGSAGWMALGLYLMQWWEVYIRWSLCCKNKKSNVLACVCCG